MKGQKLDIWCQNKSGGDHELCKVVGEDALVFVAAKVDARLLQGLDRFWEVHVFTGMEVSRYRQQEEQEYALETKPEVELPGGAVRGGDAILVSESETDLNDLEEIHVTAHCLVVVVR